MVLMEFLTNVKSFKGIINLCFPKNGKSCLLFHFSKLIIFYSEYSR